MTTVVHHEKILTDFLETRKLNRDIADAFGLRIQVLKGKPMVVFPYIQNGVECGHKARTPDKSDFYSTPNRDLFNIDAAFQFDDGPVIITEGELDCMALQQAGKMRVISLPHGWNSGNKITDQLDSIRTILESEKQIIVAADADEAGESLPRQIFNHMWGFCETPNVGYCVWPKDCKDANDVLIKHDVEVLQKCIRSHRKVAPPGGIIHGVMSPPPSEKRRRLLTGTFLDHVIPFETRELSIGTGHYGSGKSHMAFFAGFHIAQKNNTKVGFINFENDNDRLRDQALRMLTKGKLKYEEMSFEEKQQHQDKIDWLDEHILVVTKDDMAQIIDADGEERSVVQNVAWALDFLKQLITVHKCEFVVLDPWNELSNQLFQGETTTQFCNDALSEIRKVASNLGAHICILAHPTKAVDLKEVPVGRHVADSLAFANKPGMGWSVYNSSEPDGECYVVNWKIRNVTSNKDLFGNYITKGVKVNIQLNLESQLYWAIEERLN